MKTDDDEKSESKELLNIKSKVDSEECKSDKKKNIFCIAVHPSAAE